jgi:N-formylglutamate amidohydrolase
MNRIPIRSSTIHSVGYESATEILEIEFNTGWIYEYYGVPNNVYHNLMNASSKGIYHKENIKFTYRYKRIR